GNAVVVGGEDVDAGERERDGTGIGLEQGQLAGRPSGEGAGEHRRPAVAHRARVDEVVADRADTLRRSGGQAGRLQRSGGRGAGGPRRAHRGGWELLGEGGGGQIEPVEPEGVRGGGRGGGDQRAGHLP